MRSIHVSAPGKLILLGEHIVVYGKPALISSITKRCHCFITPRTDKKIKIVSKNLGISTVLTEKEILNKTKGAQEQWKKFSTTNDITLLKTITKDPLDYPILIIGESLLYFKKSLSSGFTLTIDSEIPIGAGLGSSAALAVAIAGAASLLFTTQLDKEIVNIIAFAAEQKKHGFPSGGDNSTCCYGGLIWYKKETTGVNTIKQIPFSITPKIARNFLTVFTGTPHESTGEMVSAVRNLYNKNKKKIETIFTDQEILAQNLLTAVKQEDENGIISCIQQGEANLEKLGVVSQLVKKLIRNIEKTGSAAKICGGGGKRKGTGTVLIYSSHTKAIEQLLTSSGFLFSQISLDTEGLREEK